eukprot:m.37156 g.37156  ORF g.37156 m.37156 type:complete len:74 (+) comp17591_c0_seq1:29-250(+)
MVSILLKDRFFFGLRQSQVRTLSQFTMRRISNFVFRHQQSISHAHIMKRSILFRDEDFETVNTSGTVVESVIG